MGRGEFDLTDVSSIPRVLNFLHPSLIVNAAAYTAVDQAEGDEREAFAVNAEAPSALAQWAALNDAALIHYSTDYVFDGRKASAYVEEDALSPLNVYGRSKLAGEMAVRDSGAAHLILRTSWVYSSQGRNFLTTMLRLGAEKEELRVVADQVGAPTSASWLAEATAEILEKCQGDPLQAFRRQGGLFHAVCSGETSWHGFAQAIFENARNRGLPCKLRSLLPIPSAEYPLPAERPANSRLSTAKLQDVWGVLPPPWREALDSVMEEMI
ncbi:MAG: dTDP-4-dehydrorhamnose reductase [Rhodospirillales bacterium]|nr:MAG: dTDP-4-dehydrorhamnose reductase [Rhodospirillales bacterium]